jgi:fucose 4-O-acetylase-like acetyltransferase
MGAKEKTQLINNDRTVGLYLKHIHRFSTIYIPYVSFVVILMISYKWKHRTNHGPIRTSQIS